MAKLATIPKARVLLIDDDPDVSRVVTPLLEPEFAVRHADNRQVALELVDRDEPDVLLLDLNLGDGVEGGLSLLECIRARDPHLPVIVLSSYKDTDTIVRAMKAGASHYIGKTPRQDELVEQLRLCLQERDRNRRLEAHRYPGKPELLGNSPAMEQVRDLGRKAARSDLPVLLLGETGTGKSLVARCIHRWSDRAEGPFGDVNIAALSSSVLDSELFGHERGAFTGADRRRRGLFELAGGGFVFLDEIGDLPRECQVKLLKVVEDHRFRRVGGDGEIHTDIRVIAATNTDLEALVACRAFREDLFHRLAGLVIVLPALRDRREDIPELARAFAGESCSIAPAALDWLSYQPWPGNVRQLQQAVRRATLFSESGDLDIDVFQTAAASACSPGHLEKARDSDVGSALLGSARGARDVVNMTHDEAMQRARMAYLSALLEECDGNVSLAARRSGLSRSHFHTLITELGLSRPLRDKRRQKRDRDSEPQL